MKIKLNENNKKYVIKKAEVNIGSALLKKKENKIYDRVTYIIDNMISNKAYQYAKNKNNLDEKELLKNFQDKYKKYRNEWANQPSQCINNKYLGDDLKKHKRPPLCIDIETAALCDLACPFCFREFTATPDKIINEKFCYDLIDQAAELKVPSIKFNWRGEPLLHPKLPDFIDYAKKKGILETIINTNATHLNSSLSKKLIQSGLDFIIYSFDGGTKETYEKLRPGRFKKNRFDDVYNNIKDFKKIRDKMNSKLPFTKIQMILTKETFHEKDNFFDLFADCVDDVSLNQYTERGGKLSDLDEDGLSQYCHKLEINNLAKGAPYMRDAFGNIKVARGRKPCEQPFQRMLITYEGRVAMCCYDWGATHPVGFTNSNAFTNNKDYDSIINNAKNNRKGFELLSNIKMPKLYNNPQKKVNSLKDIWYGAEIDKVRKKHIDNKGETVPICKHCSFKDVYNWI